MLYAIYLNLCRENLDHKVLQVPRVILAETGSLERTRPKALWVYLENR